MGYKYEIIFTPAHHQEVGWLCNLYLRSYGTPLCTKGDSYCLGQSPSQRLEVEATFKGGCSPRLKPGASRTGVQARQPASQNDKVFSSANQKESVRYECLVASTSSPSTSSVAALRTNNKTRLNSTEGFLAATHAAFCLTVHSITYLKTFVKPFF